MLINCDLGEGLHNDAELMPCLDMANIACGAHAGDEQSILETIALAQAHHVQIGAHIGFADKDHFGRREISMSSEDIIQLCAEQLNIMHRSCEQLATTMRYVKPHGALYNMMMKDDRVLKAIMQAVAGHDSSLKLLIMAVPDYQRYQQLAQGYAITLMAEAFVDRAYTAQGQLLSRSEQGACFTDIEIIEGQARSIIQQRHVISNDGSRISIQADTLCIHGDSPLAVETAWVLRKMVR